MGYTRDAFDLCIPLVPRFEKGVAGVVEAAAPFFAFWVVRDTRTM